MLLERTLGRLWRGDLLLLYHPRESDASLPLEVLAVSSVLVNLSCLSLPESVERLGGVRVARATAASGKTSLTLPASSAASVEMSSAPICPSSADLTSSPCVCPSEPWACSSGPCECPCPPRTKNPTIFEARPNEPTIRMSCGFVIVAMLTNLVMASRMIERHRAIRNTALKKAPRISARNHCEKLATVLSFGIEDTYTKGIFVRTRLLRSFHGP